MKLQNDFLEALLKEITLRKEYIDGARVNTIYFGGGTPSLLPPGDVDRILNTLSATFRLSIDVEITLEANPDDITTSRLREWKVSGINRLSIGVQSFYEQDLQWMNRAHNAIQADECIRQAQDEGFYNMSIDLIYGTPGLTDDRWEHNLSKAAKLQIPHLSCYALTVEEKTALDTMIKRNQVSNVNHEDQARQFLLMTGFLTSKGYEHYEISNFALPGKRSVHNSSYWQGESYLGLGPSAHSFNSISRQWNVSNNALYIQSLKNDQVPFEIEHLSPVQRLNEYLMTSLRTIEGMDMLYIIEHFGDEQKNRLIKESRNFIEKEWMLETGDRLVLTRNGKLYADGIASQLFAT